MKKKLIVLVFLLLILPIVFGGFNLPTRSFPSITKSVTLITKICNDDTHRCFNNALQVCFNNAWTVKEQCTATQYCNQLQGCISKNIVQQPTARDKTEIIKRKDLTRIKGKLPKALTYVNCEEFKKKGINFPEKTYEELDDCQLLQNRALVDDYIKKTKETSKECYKLARENIGSFNGRIQDLIQEVNNVNEIDGRGITESADLMMQEAQEKLSQEFGALINTDENNPHKIKKALDALTSQVKNLCEAANRINGNIFNLCQDINKYISTGLDRHEPGLTEEEKKGFIKALQNQKNLANTNFNLAKNNYKQVYKKNALDDMIYVKGVENVCKQPSSYYAGYMSEAEKRKKGLLTINKDTAKFKQ